MNNYLIELFKTENTVIIPGFGALTMVNRAANELMFMSFMKHNDGTLVNYVTQVEQCDSDTAKQKVDAFIDEINFALNNGNQYVLKGLGIFSKDNSGDVVYSSGSDSITEAIVEDVKEIKEEVVVEPLPIIEPTVVQEEQSTITVVQEVVEEPIEKIEEKVEIEEVEPVVPEPVIEETIVEEFIIEDPVVEEQVQKTEPEVPATTVLSQEEQWNDDLDLPPVNFKPERPKKPILEKTKKDKVKRSYGSLWLILFALLIFGGATYVGLNYKELKEKIPFLASKQEEKHEVIEDVVIDPQDDLEEEIVEAEEEAMSPDDEVVEEEPVVEQPAPKETKLAPVVSSNGNFRLDKSLPVQIIVGSFGEESNANRMVKKLQAQGFPAQIIGVYGGLHTVSAASFSSMEEYKANIPEVEKVGAYWVKK